MVKFVRVAAVVAGFALSSAGCASMGPSPTTGLTGTVTRGPVTPVCRVDVPCDAPFSASFTVQQNGRQVAQFRSDQNGQFTVFLNPGSYNVVPGTDAPIISPAQQGKPVTVANSGGLTVVQLSFDTGIR